MPDDMSHGVLERLSLDARELMSCAEQEPKRSFVCSLIHRNGRLVACQDAPQGTKLATVMFSVNWPESSQTSVTGVLWITNLEWDMFFYPIPLTGDPKRAGGWLWRFLCPSTRSRVQTLHLDKAANRFISREAIGSPKRPENPARVHRHLMELTELGVLAGGLDSNFAPIKKPTHIEDWLFEALEYGISLEFLRWRCATYGMPQPTFGNDGSVVIPVRWKGPRR